MSNSPKSPESILRLGEARLDLVPALADCNPGIRPVEYNVVIAPAAAPKTVGKAGILIAADDTQESAQMAMQVGRIVALSPHAFGYERWADEDLKPKVGDLVWYARYAGTAQFEGIDGKPYRICKDKDIGAVIEPPQSLWRAPAEVEAMHEQANAAFRDYALAGGALGGSITGTREDLSTLPMLKTGTDRG